jgi:hypothetical protein
MEMSLVKDIQTQYKDEYTENFEIITTYKILEDEEYANEDAIRLVNNNERRRLPYQIQDDKWNYIPKLCENKWNCRFGLNCHFAHSRLEQIYHPSNFKVKKCENDIIADDDYCLKSGANCTFYHNDYEKRTSGLQKRVFDLSTYKIYKCNKVGCDENCINYHDITERRRDPILFSYSEVPCINVRPGTDFLPRNCENGDYCNLAHSKNEVYYHENNYKKRTCFRVDCRLKYCAFTHVTNETTSETKKVQDTSEVDSRQFTGFMSNGSRSASVVSSKHTEHKPEDSSSDFNGVDVPEADTKIYNCKSCQSSEITYMFTTCGASLCISCLTKVCYICKVAHLNTVKF